jgi:hypothetical protein
LNQLCRFWFIKLRRTDSITTDPLTGKIVAGPLLTFLRAATAPVLPKNHPLTPDSARHAERTFKESDGAQFKRRTRVGKKEKTGEVIGVRATHNRRWADIADDDFLDALEDAAE